MPIVRDPRNDRRRRVLRENAAQEQAASAASAKRSATKKSGQSAEVSPRKGAGYSQDVRQACGHRLVQLIPVRPASYASVIAISLLVPALLSAAHYLVYVNGKLPWYGHPLALTLDANYNRSIASWVTGQLWLLCLGATVLTFQLRRHKLDDYSGEYRLWFWLVLTCIVGSLESSTGIIQLFSLALDHWSTTTLGWSGPAVVKATLAVLVGMLGIRLCTELKAAPSSVVCVMLGLIAWAVSSALAQPEFQVELSEQVRVWARCSLWLGGLTCIWLAALANLRHVYIEAQERFLSRRRMLAPAGSMPISERIRSAMPSFPSRDRDSSTDNADDSRAQSRWRLPSLRQSKDNTMQLVAELEDNKLRPSKHDEVSADADSRAQIQRTGNRDQQLAPDSRSKSRPTASSTQQHNDNQSKDEEHGGSQAGNDAKQRRGLGSFFKRGRSNEEQGSDEQAAPNSQTKRDVTQDQNALGRSAKSLGNKEKPENKPNRWTAWLRKPKHSDDAEEYRKIPRDEETAAKRQPTKQDNSKREEAASDQQSASQEGAPRRWIPRAPKPKMPKLKKPSFGWLPKVSLSALRLKPPADQAENEGGKQQKIAPKQQLPSTEPREPAANQHDEEGNSRPLTKAERKRLRRMQQQNRAA